LKAEIEGVILAGGKSSRMGQNKSLVLLDKKPLIKHIFSRMKNQVEIVRINTNEPLSIFSKSIQFKDMLPGQLGPASGILSGLNQAKSDWVQFCPNDTPFFPTNLVAKLSAYIDEKNPKIILPISNGRLEPVFLLCHKYLEDDLKKFISSGERKLEIWIRSNNFQTVNFKEKEAFININTMTDLQAI
jgi:molybdopterin-guanine dinucleotide biosynthesis protein A